MAKTQASAANPNDDALFAALDLSRPALAAVKTAMERGDRAAARAALARHFRTRTTPRWLFDPAHPPQDRDEGGRKRADDALAHTFTVVGIPHTFGPKIDWRYNPTTQPGSPDARDHEWTWQLNRHAEWTTLAQAYTATHDPRYARELVAQITGWLRDNPPPTEKADNDPFSRWRTIEAGIRTFGAWPAVFHHMVRQPDVFPDDVLLAFVDGFRKHGEYLHAFHATGNWLIMEMNGLFTIGVLFPEFKAASLWREEALARLRAEMDVQIYPDGPQFELSPGYHNGMIGHFVGALKLARLNDIVLPDGYAATLERMYDVLLWAMSPDRDVPHLNDSWEIDVPNRLRAGRELFPARRDWLWIASDGKEGAPPAHASHLFPWAGWAVMRSGWDRDARFLLMDGGPFGYGHQHEDKLSFVLHAYGQRLIFDAGSYAYDASAMRQYVLSARGHNVVHVDGLEQHRRGAKSRMDYVTRAPVPLVWRSTPDYDYAEASFGAQPEEGWGPDKRRSVVHTRRILFVKAPKQGEFWIVADTLRPDDSDEHTYESTFHLDAPEVVLDDTTRQVTTKGDEHATLGILPLAAGSVGSAGKLEARIISGQETPFLQGWLPNRHGRTGASPRPVVYYTRRGRGPIHFVYVFAPAPTGKSLPVTAVRDVPDNDAVVVAADLVLADGETRRFTLGERGEATLLGGPKAMRVEPSS